MAAKAKTKGDRAWMAMLTGFVALAALVGGLGYWSVTAQLAGAVVAPGIIRVESNRQVIQHPDGGVVGEILAKDGDRVEAGDVLIRFDPTKLRLELNVVEGQLYEIAARVARLEAERDHSDRVVFPDFLMDVAATNEAVHEQMEGQLQQFAATLHAYNQEQKLLNETVKQLEDRVRGLIAQLKAVDMRSEIIAAQLTNKRSLLERGLSLSSAVADMELEEAALIGERGRIVAEIAEHKGQVAAVGIQRIKLETDRSGMAIQRLRDLQYSMIELTERRKELKEALNRLEVKAPVAGVIYGSKVHALQSVVKPADSIMFVVPQDQNLVIATRISTSDIDQVAVGQDTTLRFTAFNQRQTPELEGTVSFVAADATTDETSGQSFYMVEMLPKPKEFERLEGQILLPGMPVEGFIKTDTRTPLAYLTKPLTDYFERAFRG